MSRAEKKSKKSKESKSRAERLKSLPWAAMLQGSVVVGRRWRALSAKDRERLTELARESRGRLGNLSVKERTELRKLARKLDLKGMGAELLALRRVRARRRRRRGA
ncbi:MAG: hypothetical protein ACLQBB_12145 [Solirubrobacteraceae bacterium]